MLIRYFTTLYIMLIFYYSKYYINNNKVTNIYYVHDVVTKSADGRHRSRQYDDDGNRAFDRSQSDRGRVAANGSLTPKRDFSDMTQWTYHNAPARYGRLTDKRRLLERHLRLRLYGTECLNAQHHIESPFQIQPELVDTLNVAVIII